jgi:Beta-lactamase class C and other penicillin binding proteins
VPYAPGTHYWYSNLGFQTLGYTLEKIEHAPLHSIIERRVLDRIGMSASTAIIDDALRTRLPVSYQIWPYGNQVSSSRGSSTTPATAPSCRRARTWRSTFASS